MPAVHGVVRWRLIDLAEPNPVENIWQFMRDNWLSNRVFQSYDDILDLMFYGAGFIHNLVSEEQLAFVAFAFALIKSVQTRSSLANFHRTAAPPAGRQARRKRPQALK
jgi:hypothetical protein